MEPAKIQEQQVRKAIDFICTSEHYHKRWEEIAKQLGYSKDTIKLVKKQESELNKQCFYFLKYVWWENMGSKAAVDHICDALGKCGMKRAKEKLEAHCANADPNKAQPSRKLPSHVLKKLDKKDLNLAAFLLSEHNPNINILRFREALLGYGEPSDESAYLSHLWDVLGMGSNDSYYWVYFLLVDWPNDRKATISRFLESLTTMGLQRTRADIEEALDNYHSTGEYPDIPDVRQKIMDYIKKNRTGEGSSADITLPQGENPDLEESQVNYASLSEKTLLDLANQIGRETELMSLAIGLGLETKDVDSIKYKHQDINMAVFNVLKK